MALANVNPLAIYRINAIFEEIVEQNDQPGNRLWSSRIEDVPAEDEEIFARIGGIAVAADIIENDQAAPIHSDNPVRLTQTEIPKLKHGMMISEAQLKLLRRIQNGLANTRERNFFDDYVANSLRLLLEGVKDRQELMLCAMLSNSLTYNKYGIQLSGVDWKAGPTTTNIKGHTVLTPSTAWNNVNATPISDTLAARQDNSFTYGEMYDTMTISTQCLKNIIATTEFRSLEPLFRSLSPVGTGISTNLPAAGYSMLLPIVGAMLGMNIELYDRRTHEEALDATISTTRFQPIGDVYLTASQDWNDKRIWDWANGVLIETYPGIIPNLIGGDFQGESFGPVSYATAGNAQGNPPGWLLWAAKAGFPRLHHEPSVTVIHAF